MSTLYVRVSPSSSVAVTGTPMSVPSGTFSSTVNIRGSGAPNTGEWSLGHSTVELLVDREAGEGHGVVVVGVLDGIGRGHLVVHRDRMALLDP